MTDSDLSGGGELEVAAAQSTLAGKLERLFETIPNPATGKRYTNNAAAEAIDELVAALPEEERVGRSISPQYIWQLRRGVKDNPTLKHLKSLAALFGVEPDVFLNDTAYSDLAGELSVIAAMRHSGVDQIAFRARGLSPAGVNAVLAALDHARAVEGLPAPDESPGPRG
ncbi:hypothetical protein EV383_6224 [Pseudonocardia sediminis]|uniref:HTH cro/C1-type domain-containing protein n=1 Tax=Pseudonocardia sediminis TaxID=1397368 RepID=A0A4Q7U7G8_PSEST|nr:helix-turn-helix transcriptional regulator [Pseudonocardia sediminis]RZT75484.1 hypothetical protein EV383_6224 [Pseudonocardia sediminis]